MMSVISSGDVGLMYKEFVILSGKTVLKIFLGWINFSIQVWANCYKKLIEFIAYIFRSFINLPLCVNESEVDKCDCFLFITSFMILQVSFKLPRLQQSEIAFASCSLVRWSGSMNYILETIYWTHLNMWQLRRFQDYSSPHPTSHQQWIFCQHLCFVNARAFPKNLKSAIIPPLLKKPGLEKSEPANYRPISNLNTIGKLLERLVRPGSPSTTHQLLIIQRKPVSLPGRSLNRNCTPTNHDWCPQSGWRQDGHSIGGSGPLSSIWHHQPQHFDSSSAVVLREYRHSPHPALFVSQGSFTGGQGWQADISVRGVLHWSAARVSARPIAAHRLHFTSSQHGRPSLCSTTSICSVCVNVENWLHSKSGGSTTLPPVVARVVCSERTSA